MLGSSSTALLDLSLALDMETFQITGELILDSRLQYWLEAARKIAPRTFEVLLCSSGAFPEKVTFPPEIKAVVYPGLGYYGMKNKAAELANGKIVFFGDIDCRPDPDYLVNLLNYFDTHPEAVVVGGRTFYDGEDFVTRANSAVAWGYLHGKDALLPGEVYAGHNVGIRGKMFPKPFGPYTDRYGGDEYFTNSFRRQGYAMPLLPSLKIYHESPADSLRGLLDRHFRELTRLAFMKQGLELNPLGVIREATRSGRGRWQVFKKNAHKFGISRNEWFKGRVLFRFYALLDMACAIVLWLRPSLFQKWVRYQFGDLQRCEPATGVESLLPNPATVK